MQAPMDIQQSSFRPQKTRLYRLKSSTVEPGYNGVTRPWLECHLNQVLLYGNPGHKRPNAVVIRFVRKGALRCVGDAFNGVFGFPPELKSMSLW